jgi:Fur family ferric uptake transcriptional regulator
LHLQAIAIILEAYYNNSQMRVKKAEEAKEALRELGYRLTPQRQLILTTLQQSDEHISAEEIHARVCAIYQHINISTIYRTLELLKNLDLVTETDLGGGRLRYHYADKGHHHHLICERCGTIIDVDESLLLPIQQTLFREYGFRANISHLAIFGRCTKCQ